jgi:hypothetical protein
VFRAVRALFVASFFLYSSSASTALANSWLATDVRQTAGMPGAEDEGPPVRSDGRTVAMSGVADMRVRESRPDAPRRCGAAAPERAPERPAGSGLVA